MPQEDSPSGTGAEALRQLKDLFDAPISGVDQRIDRADEMFDANREHYHGVGQSALRMVKLALLASGKAPSEVKQILDLPCGHGRVLRALHAAFPDAQLTACDIQRDGVDYCTREFGARPVYSRDRIEAVSLDSDFDLIWCGSLLTHLDAPRWDDFLAYFAAHLNPGGLLIFTVHGASVLRRFQSGWDYGLDLERIRSLVDGMQESGFGYVDYPNQEQYGISIADRAWTLNRLAKHRDLRALVYCDRGWDDHQDVIACCRDTWQAPPGPAEETHAKLDFGIET